MSPRKLMDSSIPLRERLIESAWEQGPITVAFFLLIGTVFYKADAILTRFESGYERNAHQLLKVTEEHKKAIDGVMTQWREDRQLLIDVLRRDHEALQKAGVVGDDNSIDELGLRDGYWSRDHCRGLACVRCARAGEIWQAGDDQRACG